MKLKALPPLLVLYSASVRTMPLLVPEPVPVRVTMRDVMTSTSLGRWRSSSFGFKRMGLNESIAILNAEAISVRLDMIALQEVLDLQAGSAGACWRYQC